MSILTILEHPDPQLRLPSSPVTEFGAEVATLIDDLFDTLYASGGVALSAPQCGIQQQVLVMDFSSDHSQGEVLINPTIRTKAKLGLTQESCLSLPGLFANVFRAMEVQVDAQDASGNKIEQQYEMFPAASIQHEIDHLNGVLFIDRLPWFEKLRLKLKRTKLAPG